MTWICQNPKCRCINQSGSTYCTHCSTLKPDGWVMRLLPILILIVCGVSFLYIDHSYSVTVTPPVVSDTCTVEDLGSNLYYFHCTGAHFGEVLPKYAKDHGLGIQSIVGNGTGIQGADLGYWVVLR